MKKTKWLIYTVIVGLTPFFIRFLIWLLSNTLKLNYILNEVDMVTFGLVLNITNINELEDKESLDKQWKTWMMGFSTIMVMAAFLGITYFSEVSGGTFINRNNVKYCSLFLGVLSFGVSYAIYNRLNKMSYEQ